VHQLGLFTAIAGALGAGGFGITALLLTVYQK
jgi:hypothetical protein